MIASSKDGRYLVECHIPLSFVRPHQHIDSYWDAFTEWRDAINGVNFVPDARRYGRINLSELMFWVEEVCSLTFKGRNNRWGYFEMIIRCGLKKQDVYETLCGLYGPHFFIINIEIDKTPGAYGGLRIKKFLTPVLIARQYGGYEETMDGVFGPLEPYFQWNPDSADASLPMVSLR